VGDLMTDIVAVYSGQLAAGSDTPARIRVRSGGSAANTAAWLARLGVPATLVGVVGADEAGDTLVAELARAGVRCAVRRATQAPTGAVIVLATGDERTMLCDRGANALLVAADLADAFDGAAHLHLHLSGYTMLDAGTAEVGRFALAHALARGATTSVDAASAAPLRRLGGATFRSWIHGVDLLLANADEAATLLDDDDHSPAAERATRLTGVARRVVVKLGAAGAVWAEPDGTLIEAPAEPAVAVDPTGAGDAFAAGLLAAWLGGAPAADALRAGVRLGGLAVRNVGGRPPAG
jgi:sugar/nucleoside kinase (ribokinase family)